MTQQPPARPSSENNPAPAPAEPVHEEGDGDGESSARLLFQYVPSWMTSFLLHISVVILLALIPILIQEKETLSIVAGDAGPAVETQGEINLDPLDDFSEALDAQTAIDVANPTLQPLTEAPPIENLSEQMSLSEFLEPAASGLADAGEAMSAALSGGNEFAGRAAAGNSKEARDAGSNPPAEECVALGLQWLAAHQLEDGSWNFDHQIGPGDRTSPNPGVLADCPIGATAMCLMAFLGNGQTHVEGTYKEQVSRAINYLIKSQKRVNEYAGSMVDPHYYGGMYGHAMATIALAEAYGMTKDPALHEPAQAALRFIEYAQNRSGGWRYRPQDPGDLSVSGWMIMAIKSGLMSDLDIPKSVTKRSAKFLDSVEVDSGAKYNYRPNNQDTTPDMVAVGLLCRMYMGWKRDHSSMQRGVKYLADLGPRIGDSTNMYFNYYATQVLRQYGGPEWTKWNLEMRDYLIKTQSRDGAKKGSWFFDSGTDRGPAAGGRIYCTAMSVMTLEVYYRFLPIYRDQAMQDDFPLD